MWMFLSFFLRPLQNALGRNIGLMQAWRVISVLVNSFKWMMKFIEVCWRNSTVGKLISLVIGNIEKKWINKIRSQRSLSAN